MLWKTDLLSAVETFISGETKGEPFFSLTSSSLGCIFLRFGLVGGIVAFSSIGSGSYKRRNLSLKIFNMFGQLVLEKLDKRLHCLFISICMCETRTFLSCFVGFFRCSPPFPALGGKKKKLISFEWGSPLHCLFTLDMEIFSVLPHFFLSNLLCFVFLF